MNTFSPTLPIEQTALQSSSILPAPTGFSHQPDTWRPIFEGTGVPGRGDSCRDLYS